ncbi:hypothetical protein [Methanococcus aeolicus]|uniref:Uncharacterized protein n=1 Tax=Methanococcus aeolicus (strain ATCC BAA-1280 / DSM 17508 / OCM 812 / Nankai-3) TaxID=419665 RepID=A6UTP1_META3|nr:hypothetical protein [Methanococcus aeolicus]ABR55863.1 hypothetical protein Maeo_0274 [Methanococcus aeolicus Nankai-3]UXM84031.1 hypothetical protein N6C89_04485 [Methanococcus aeolicus]
MDEIDFDFVIDKISKIKDESVKAGVLCELAEGLINSNDDQDEVIKRLLQMMELTDAFKDEKYSSIVIGQIALVSANIMGIPCDSELYIGMLEDKEAELAFMKRIKDVKKEIEKNTNLDDLDLSELEK